MISRRRNTAVWDPETVKVEAGIGIRSFWTLLGAVPLTAQRDMVLNCHVEIDFINPVRSDVIGTRVTDLAWDKLSRVGLDGESGSGKTTVGRLLARRKRRGWPKLRRATGRRATWWLARLVGAFVHVGEDARGRSGQGTSLGNPGRRRIGAPGQRFLL